MTGEIEVLNDPEPGISCNRLDNITISPDGALWVGTMSEGAKGPTVDLYRCDASVARRMMSGTTITNGLFWSPHGRCLYFVASVPGLLHMHTNGEWQILRRFDELTGRPFGLTVDSNSTIWVAICDRGEVWE